MTNAKCLHIDHVFFNRPIDHKSTSNDRLKPVMTTGLVNMHIDRSIANLDAQAHLSFPAPINLISTKSLWTDLYIVFRSPKKLSISSSDDDLEACKYLFDIRFMLKSFEHFSLSVVNKMLVFRAEIHKNACQNSKQRRPWSEAVWSGSALFVLQGFS